MPEGTGKEIDLEEDSLLTSGWIMLYCFLLLRSQSDEWNMRGIKKRATY
jgi:hypothetical protein